MLFLWELPQKIHRHTLDHICSRLPFTLVELDVCGIPLPISSSDCTGGRKSNITAYRLSIPINYSSQCMHLSSWLTFNKYTFTLYNFLIGLSCLDCTHHYICHSCNYHVINGIQAESLYKFCFLKTKIPS